MYQPTVLDLSQCGEFRQTLEARPPRIVHATTILVVALLGALLAWSALTRAELVVRAGGRVRPVTAPQKVMATFRGEVLTGGAGARVCEVHFREGQFVNRGDVLIRLDTERLDNEIERMNRKIEAGEVELRKGTEMAKLLQEQFHSSRSKLQAEIDQAKEELRLAKQRRDSEMRVAGAGLRHAQDQEALTRKLVKQGVAVRVDLEKAVLDKKEASEKLAQASLPIEDSKPEVLSRGLAALGKDHHVKLAELSVKQDAKRGEVEAARLELANLQLEHRQAVIRAPISGVVTTGDIKPGDTLDPGKPVVEVAEQNGFRFELGVPTAEMEDIEVGMPVRIRLDAYDYQRYGTVEGIVQYIGADSTVDQENGAAYYIVKVEVNATEVGRGELRGPLKLGLTGQAEIVTGQESLLSLLTRKIRRTISLG
jgi:multidrug resistance efflux pump